LTLGAGTGATSLNLTVTNNNKAGPFLMKPNQSGKCTVKVTFTDHIETTGTAKSKEYTFHVCEVNMARSGTASTPDIWPDICTNAQTVYKTAKYTATVKGGSASATVAVNSPHSISGGSQGSNAQTVTVNNGDTITVTGSGTSQYTLTITHSNKDVRNDDIEDSSNTGEVFKFEQDTTTFSGGTNTSGPGNNSSNGTSQSNKIQVAIPVPNVGNPPSASYNGFREFDATLKIKTTGTSTYAKGVKADVSFNVHLGCPTGTGRILTLGIAGINPGGGQVGLSSGSLQVSTRTSINGSWGAPTSHSVSAPTLLIVPIGVYSINTTVNASRSDVVFSGTSFPKTTAVKVESTAAATITHTTIQNVGFWGIATTVSGQGPEPTGDAQQNTLPPLEPYSASYAIPIFIVDEEGNVDGTPELSNFRIVP
jgi:hypothetical protein